MRQPTLFTACVMGVDALVTALAPLLPSPTPRARARGVAWHMYVQFQISCACSCTACTDCLYVAVLLPEPLISLYIFHHSAIVHIITAYTGYYISDIY